jgi:hypothetical protein
LNVIAFYLDNSSDELEYLKFVSSVCHKQILVFCLEKFLKGYWRSEVGFEALKKIFLNLFHQTNNKENELLQQFSVWMHECWKVVNWRERKSLDFMSYLENAILIVLFKIMNSWFQSFLYDSCLLWKENTPRLYN